MRLINHYYEDTKEFYSRTEGLADPLNPSETLLPANATYDDEAPVPVLAENEAAIFDGVEFIVTPDFRGITYFLKSDGSEVFFDLGEVPDATVDTVKPTDVLLIGLKAIKAGEITSLFNAAVEAPVDVAGVLYHGGYESVNKLDGAYRLAEKLGLTSITFTDSNRAPHDLLLADANTVILTIGQQYQFHFLNKQAKLIEVEEAVDEAELDLITY